jgi:glucose/arabinose dehydrogenase
MARRVFPAVLCLLLAGCGEQAASAQSGLGLQRIGGFDQPVHVTAPPGDDRRVFVVEQPGRIYVVLDGRKLPRPFLDIRGRVQCCGEQGLFSMAFAPDYGRSGRFYVSYTGNGGDSRVEEYRRAGPNLARPSSRRLVLFQRQPEANHNGGQIAFGPDRRLYVAFGDGGGANDQHGARGNAQNLNSLLGKILRIDPRPARGRRYGIPAHNPFVGRPGRNEIWSYGLRNPWRFSFDRRTGYLAIGDVGQDRFEEIDFVRTGRGVNFGWRPWEGRRRNFNEPARRAVFPVLTYPTGRRGCAVVGGFVVRDPLLRGWGGRYLYGDNCNPDIRTARLAPGRASGERSTGLRVPALSSFGEDARGRVYAASLNGPVYRFVSR